MQSSSKNATYHLSFLQSQAKKDAAVKVSFVLYHCHATRLFGAKQSSVRPRICFEKVWCKMAFIPDVGGFYRNFKKRAVRWLEDNRGLVIFFFCLPASFLFDLILELRLWVKTQLFSAPWKHDARVRKIQDKVRQWAKLPAEKRKPLCTARPNWLSLSTTFFRKVRFFK